MASTRVSKRYRITVPAGARRTLNIRPGDRLLADVQDGMLVLLPEPKDYARALEGLHKDIWQGIDAVAYVAAERRGW